jgi:hypothetical protein
MNVMENSKGGPIWIWYEEEVSAKSCRYKGYLCTSEKKNLDYFQAPCISPTLTHVQKLYTSSSNSSPIFKMLKALDNKKIHNKNIEKGHLEQIGPSKHLNIKE